MTDRRNWLVGSILSVFGINLESNAIELDVTTLPTKPDTKFDALKFYKIIYERLNETIQQESKNTKIKKL